MRIREHLAQLVNKVHGADVHHHDIRRANLVRHSDGLIRLIDFNLSTANCTNASSCPDDVCLKYCEAAV